MEGDLGRSAGETLGCGHFFNGCLLLKRTEAWSARRCRRAINRNSHATAKFRKHHPGEEQTSCREAAVNHQRAQVELIRVCVRRRLLSRGGRGEGICCSGGLGLRLGWGRGGG